MTELKIYVACLAAYNNGILHGEWIDATLEPDDIQQAINQMLKASPIEDAEEYAIHDYEGFYSYPIGEYEGIESAHNIAAFIEEHGELGANLLCDLNDIEEASTALEERYRGCYKSLADFAEDYTSELADIPQSLLYYIDYDRMGRDLQMGGDIFTINTAYNEVHIFWSY